MNTETPPVDVNISIESLSIEREAFYNICFITENDVAPRTLEVSKLKDLLDNGYDRFSLAYNFCVGVFSQQGIPSIKVRAKRVSESYEDAFDADDNTGYYFIVIESKDKNIVSNFNTYINTSDDYKLLFYSSDEDAITNSELVQYYQSRLSTSNLINNKVVVSDYYINKAFNTNYDDSGIELATVEQLQQARLAYPEAAWVALCGNKFPSSVHWLYKYLSKVDVNGVKTIPDLTSTTSVIYDNKSTVGSGTTTYGTPIHEKISFDWVKWALSRRVWDTLYTKEKVNATQGGLELISNEVKAVLEVAVSENIFNDYRIIDTSLNRNTNTISVKFEASLSYTILEVELSGSLYY
ncbi:tail sheath protein [Vibrio phage vB_VhaM_VH-8]|nr:tail sheath protein [Vibrio phage vB_VhaM_VH-8]